MQALRLGLLGLGTVGQGVVRLARRNAEAISQRVGRPVVITAASAREPGKTRDCDLDGIRIEADPMAVVRAEDVDVVVELIGGLDAADALVRAAIAAGKPVVTANKALIAERGNELFALATDAGVTVAFEAAVAGGIPIIKALREGLAGNRIDEVVGIINGTGNYILTRMQNEGIAFDSVLADAQRLGYAEADPSFDVDGIDAAHKLTILASLAFGMPLAFDSVTCEGIRGISTKDIELARQLGYHIKHLGIAKRRGDAVELRVQPTLLPETELLAKVDGVLNAVVVTGDAVGPTGYFGPGAGGDATASAVWADIVDIARDQGQIRVPPLSAQPEGIRALPVRALSETRSSHYLRLQVADEAGVLRSITSILADHDISVEAIYQREPRGEQDAVIAMITSVIGESQIIAASAAIAELPAVHGALTRMRVEHPGD
ncbi:homoserine dehydrogenase [Algiphilus sp.]|uniref:homoserine dehydrogenase n=1 Tax=Algiphilus sp. TaxID=1872431 RepID=UPI002A5FDC50|nr:homoserine dehydrogenase [Pseudomonadota bacterium]